MPNLDYLWEKGNLAGYDPEKRQWRLRSGQFATREEALGERHPEIVYGSTVSFDIAPLSRKLDNLQMVLGGLTYDGLSRVSQQAEHMPAEIMASMKLSEYFLRTEGDLWETVVVPIQLALRPVEVQAKDEGVARELQEIYDAIDLDEQLLQAWLCTEIYGQAFPLEVWDGKDLLGVVILDPKYMKVGRQVALSSPLSMYPPEGEKWGSDSWSEEALEQQISPMVYHSFASGWNEQAAKGNNIPLNRDRCYPLHDLKLAFQRYAIPSPSRCFRPLTTRQVLEEMQRATIEGFRNQLWVFKLGTDDKPAPPAAISHFRAQISGMTGERTGYLVWGGVNLEVEQHAPQSLDVVLGNEMWLALTLHTYRQRGLSLKLVTGETWQGGRASDMEWDVAIFMERMKFKRNQVLKWERHLRRSIVEAKGNTWKKAEIRVQMVKPDMELQDLVKKQLQPLGQAGWLSMRTILEKVGYSYDVELQRKLDEEPHEGRFMPRPTWAQATRFNVPQTIRETPTGRPPGATDRQQREERVEASMEFEAQDARFDAYVNSVFDLFDTLVENPTKEAVNVFIDGMKGVNITEMLNFAKDGYAVGGGAFEVDPNWIRGAIHFVNGYADNFRTDLYAAVDAERDLESFRWRVYLYPQEGRHLSYMWGLQQAMREWGARGWRRVLHPELSETGPCQACIDDSKIIHPISEGFWEPHPGGYCTAISVAYHVAPTAIPIEIPVPKKYTIPEQIRKLLERLGRIGKAVIRRVRGET